MRRFELTEGTSSKFWSVAVEGPELVVRYGRIGTDGTEKRKTLESPRAADDEADKLVREKTKKGYAEVGAAPVSGKTATTKAATAKTAKTAPIEAPPTLATAAPPKPTPPHPTKRDVPAPRAALVLPKRGEPPCTVGFALTPELDALWARGFPHLFVIGDPKGTNKADSKLVKKALDDIDPVLPVFISRRAASRFLHAYAVGKTWRWSNEARGAVHDAAKVEKVNAALASDESANLSVLEQILANSLPHGEETYPWRVQQSVYLAEALLGTEPVVQVLVRELARVSADHSLWGFRGDAGRANNHANHLTGSLAIMGLRMDRARFLELIEPLRGVSAPELVTHASIVRALFDEAHTPLAMEADFAVARRDPTYPAAMFEKGHFPWWSLGSIYVLGASWLSKADGRKLKRSPKWMQLRLVDELGTVAHEEVARIMAWLATGASARKPATQWLLDHPELARPALLRMTVTRGEEALGEAALSCLDSGGETAIAIAKSTKLTSKALDAQLDRLFAELPQKMLACDDDPAREREAMTQAFDAYCELRSAADDPTPEAYFSHHMDCFGAVDEARAARWIDLSVEVMG